MNDAARHAIDLHALHLAQRAMRIGHTKVRSNHRYRLSQLMFMWLAAPKIGVVRTNFSSLAGELDARSVRWLTDQFIPMLEERGICRLENGDTLILEEWARDEMADMNDYRARTVLPDEAEELVKEAKREEWRVQKQRQRSQQMSADNSLVNAAI